MYHGRFALKEFVLILVVAAVAGGGGCRRRCGVEVFIIESRISILGGRRLLTSRPALSCPVPMCRQAVPIPAADPSADAVFCHARSSPVHPTTNRHFTLSLTFSPLHHIETLCQPPPSPAALPPAPPSSSAARSHAGHTSARRVRKERKRSARVRNGTPSSPYSYLSPLLPLSILLTYLYDDF